MPDCGALGSVIDRQNDRLEKLETFFKEVAILTNSHDGIHFSTDDGEYDIDLAMVSPAKLGQALEKVDPEWWKHAQVLPGNHPCHS